MKKKNEKKQPRATTRSGPKQSDTRARASLTSIKIECRRRKKKRKEKKKVHRQQQHFHVTVYITKMRLKKSKIGNETAKKKRAPPFSTAS
jgi:hypothetical protein